MKIAKVQARPSLTETSPRTTEQNWYYTDLVENIGIGIIVLDLLREQIVAMNKTARKFFSDGVKPKDYRAIYHLFFEEDGNEPGHINWYVPRARVLKYGSRSFGYTIHTLQGGYMGLFVQDITQKTRQREQAEAQQFIENVDAIFAGIHQEFSRPVERMRKLLTALRNQAEGDSEKETRRFLDITLSELSKMDFLLKLLKDFESYNRTHLQSLNLSVFMPRLVSLTQQFLQRNEIKLHTVFPREPVTCTADPDLLKKALFNIITNAVDAVSNMLYPQINLGYYRNGEQIHISIEDNGHGVPPFLQEKVFHPFYSSKMGAHGLGLTITKKIITRMNGQIQVQSIQGVGTVVEIMLPAGDVVPQNGQHG